MKGRNLKTILIIGLILLILSFLFLIIGIFSIYSINSTKNNEITTYNATLQSVDALESKNPAYIIYTNEFECGLIISSQDMMVDYEKFEEIIHDNSIETVNIEFSIENNSLDLLNNSNNIIICTLTMNGETIITLESYNLYLLTASVNLSKIASIGSFVTLLVATIILGIYFKNIRKQIIASGI